MAPPRSMDAPSLCAWLIKPIRDACLETTTVRSQLKARPASRPPWPRY